MYSKQTCFPQWGTWRYLIQHQHGVLQRVRGPPQSDQAEVPVSSTQHWAEVQSELRWQACSWNQCVLGRIRNVLRNVSRQAGLQYAYQWMKESQALKVIWISLLSLNVKQCLQTKKVHAEKHTTSGTLVEFYTPKQSDNLHLDICDMFGSHQFHQLHQALQSLKKKPLIIDVPFTFPWNLPEPRNLQHWVRVIEAGSVGL